MSIVFSYKVNGVRVSAKSELPDVIEEAEVTVSGADGEAKFDLPAIVKFASPSSELFTPFSELTEAQVVSWLENMPELDPVRAHVAIVVEKEAAKLASKVKPLPWAPPPAEPAPVAPMPVVPTAE